jgi:TP901 family phage tail tape measure protein
MNEEFKQLDTRTSRERLNQLAGDAGRLGIQGKEAIMEFVDAADKINVALGDDLGENAVKNVGKLAMSFGTDKTMGLRGAMLATSSAVNELSQNSSASAGYLVDFTARVAGFGKQVGLTQTQIMGFGAVMDENMLRDEMAATAFGQLLVKMTTDLDTFARITGMKVEEYKKLVTEDINGAILAVAKSLKGRDMQDLGKVFDAMNLDGQRAIGVLATLGQKVDDVVERQKIANNAFEEGTSIINEFNVQNETVQAQLEKAQKHFHDLTIELGEKLMPIARYGITTGSLIVRLLSTLIDFAQKYAATLVTLTVTITALVAAKNKDIVVSKIMVLWNDKIIKSLKAMITVLKANPWVAVATAIAGVVGFLIDFNRKGEESVKVIDHIADAEKNAAKSAGEETKKLDVLYKAITDVNVKLETRRNLIGDLRRLYPAYFKDLTDEEILTGKAAAAYKKTVYRDHRLCKG